MLRALLALTALQPASQPDYVPNIATGAALKAEIHAVDAEIFRLLWKDCEPPEKFARFVHPDGEFYHDVNGYRKDPTASLRSIKRRCERQAKTGERSRRELIEESFHVDPVPRFGAIATGEHRFYRKLPGKAEELIGVAKFATVYKREADGWKGYRTLSYNHRPGK